MISRPTSTRTLLFALAVGALGAQSCVITVSEVDCSKCSATEEPDPLCHSSYDAASDSCVCDAGYTPANPDDLSDFECDPEEPKPGTGDCGTDPNTGTDANGNCVCTNGTQWCTDDPADLTCCTPTDPTGTNPDPTGGPTTTDPNDSDDSDGLVELPPCTAETEGEFACTNNGGEEFVEGSQSYRCEDGDWIEVDMKAECEFAGSDFSYGCYVDEGEEDEEDTVVIASCGTGPGTACTDAEDACASETELQSCLFGKLTDIDCDEFCAGEASEFQCDSGTCDEVEASCACFNDVDTPCP